MAAVILGARGWECGNSMLNAVDHNLDVDVSSAQAHTGTYSLRLNISTDGFGRWAIDGSPSSPSVSVWVRSNESTVYNVNDSMRMRFRLTTGEFIELRWDGAEHTFDAYVDGVKVADGTIEVSHMGWFHVQFYCVIDDAGSIGVKIDGHQSIDYSGDTQPAGAAGADYYYQAIGAMSIRTYYIDDLVWGSGDYLGDLRCVDIRPNADTAQDDWTPSAGDNYSTVDETPENDADYNETNTNGHADELALSDFDDTLMTPRAVVAYARARMEGAFGDSLKVGIVSNAVEVTTTHALSTAYEYYTHTADEDPNGPIAWTDVAVDALLLRYEAAIA